MCVDQMNLWHRLAHETLRITERGNKKSEVVVWEEGGDTGDGLQYGPVALWGNSIRPLTKEGFLCGGASLLWEAVSFPY